MTPLFKKLNLKDQKVMHIIISPASFNKSIKGLEKSSGIKAYSTFSGTREIEFFLGFVTKQKEVDELAQKVSSKLIFDGLF